jgi:hypothetical protein
MLYNDKFFRTVDALMASTSVSPGVPSDFGKGWAEGFANLDLLCRIVKFIVTFGSIAVVGGSLLFLMALAAVGAYSIIRGTGHRTARKNKRLKPNILEWVGLVVLVAAVAYGLYWFWLKKPVVNPRPDMIEQTTTQAVCLGPRFNGTSLNWFVQDDCRLRSFINRLDRKTGRRLAGLPDWTTMLF